MLDYILTVKGSDSRRKDHPNVSAGNQIHRGDDWPETRKIKSFQSLGEESDIAL